MCDDQIYPSKPLKQRYLFENGKALCMLSTLVAKLVKDSAQSLWLHIERPV